MKRNGRSFHGRGCIESVDLLKNFSFECLLLCHVLRVLGVGYTEMNKTDLILVFMELRVEFMYCYGFYLLISSCVLCLGKSKMLDKSSLKLI